MPRKKGLGYQQRKRHLLWSEHRTWEALTVFPLVGLDDVRFRIRTHKYEDRGHRYAHDVSENEVSSGRVGVHKVGYDSGRGSQSSNRLASFPLCIHEHSRRLGFGLDEAGRSCQSVFPNMFLIRCYRTLAQFNQNFRPKCQYEQLWRRITAEKDFKKDDS